MTPPTRRVLLLVAAVAVVSRCSGSFPSSPSPSPTPPPPPGNGPPGPPAVLVGAGDIGACGSAGVAATALLLDHVPGIVFTTGDNAYPNGTAENFLNCYHPYWGRHRERTRPVPGNHEYDSSPVAAPYFAYFEGKAGPFGLGYYAYTAGPWHVIALNSEIAVDSDSIQMQWLRNELAANRMQCTMAYWHKPLFTSGPRGPNRHMREVWRTLHEFDADLIVTGHDHLYERFAPQDADGRSDPTRGIRQITVGTGGAELYAPIRVAPNSEVIRVGFGVLKLTLADGTYEFEFMPVAGGTSTDQGRGQCH